MKKEYGSRLKKRNDQFQRDEKVYLKGKDWYFFSASKERFPCGLRLARVNDRLFGPLTMRWFPWKSCNVHGKMYLL